MTASKEIEYGGYVPGAIGRVTELHGLYYSRHWNLGLYFEGLVANELSAFLLRFNPAQDGFWTARAGERLVGSVTIDGKGLNDEGARLRWFILDPAYQGRGVGHRLLQTALDFCRQTGFRRVYLTTFAGLEAARHLYEQAGFRLCEEHEGNHWGQTLTEQTFELWLAPA